MTKFTNIGQKNKRYSIATKGNRPAYFTALIATHLLANGMSLEKIRDFLGHSSLESTQIYTHLIPKEHEQV